VATRHAPKGQVFLKKDEKLKTVVAAMPLKFSDEDFVAKFQEMYPEDWIKIVRRYEAHERSTRPGRSHPMPELKQYILNIARNYIKARQPR